MPEYETEVKATPLWCSTRFGLAILVFIGCMNMYTQRMNMSVAIVCMTRQPVQDSKLQSRCNNSASVDANIQSCRLNNTIVNTAEVGKFDWNKKTQGLVLSSFFWGYMATQVPGGWLSARYSAKHVIGWCMLGCAVVTLLMPMAAEIHVGLLVTLRVIAGLTQGVVWPSVIVVWTHWAPPLERSKLSGFGFAGVSIGTAVTLPLSGLLCSYGYANGWPSIFYTFGILGVIWVVFWMFIMYDSPVQHPRISAEERSYIVHSLKSHIDSTRKSTATPWKKMFTSIPVWAIFVTALGSEWGINTFNTNIPTYMNDVLGFQAIKSGYLAVLPYIGFWAITNTSGHLADFLRSRRYTSTTTARKLFTSIGTLVPAVSILVTGYTQNTYVAVTSLTIGVTMAGCVYGSGFVVNAIDIAPRYAGVITGISNTMSALGGILAPLAIGILTEDGTHEQWQYVFIMTACIYIVGAIFYIIFGTGVMQSWALEKDEVRDIDINISSLEKHNSEETITKF